MDIDQAMEEIDRRFIAAARFAHSDRDDAAVKWDLIRLALCMAEGQAHAAISLLLEKAVDVCEKHAFAPVECGKCWTCRVDKFLRGAGVRR